MDKNIIYIDESGIHKDTKHSTFVLVYVSIQNDESLNLGIEKIEKDLGISHFHWADFGSKMGWKIRRNFIIRAARLAFSFKYTVIKNPVNPTDELYNSIVILLTESNIQKIFIDGKQPRWYERQIKKSLNDRGIPVKNLRTVKDQSIAGIRLADALAGLIRLYYDKPEGIPKELYEYIKYKRNHLP